MDVFLTNLSLALRDVNYQNNSGGRTPQQKHQAIVDLLRNFITQLNRLKPNDLKLFEQSAFNTLVNIKFEFKYYTDLQKKISTENHTELIELRDQIFGSKLRLVRESDHRVRVTNIFKEFVKGITFFSTERVYSVFDPIYHRRGSCAPKNMKGNITCVRGEKDKAYREKSEAITKCYVERLIYDQLWTDLTNSQQDQAHLLWLDKTREDYLKCYKNFAIQIKIDYSTTVKDIPEELVIFVYKFGKLYQTFKYIKKYYQYMNDYMEPFNGYKTEAKNGKNYQKACFYLKQTKWKVAP